MTTVTVLDYGMGNLLNVARAFEHIGADVRIAETAEQAGNAERLVLPGVGAFAGGMREVKARGFDQAVREHVAKQRPLLGICLGMQMLLDVSEEFGRHEGLGLIAGRVVPVPASAANGRPHKVPHIGWSGLYPTSAGPTWERSILAGLREGAAVYFVHSFMADPADPAHRLADCLYDDQPLCAAVQKDNVFGCQFHPEKSGEVGLAILRNFLRL